MSGKLIIVVGLPRSGKSTWIEKFQAREECVVVSNDWIREHILHVKYERSLNPALWMISDGCIRIILGQNKTVVIDGVNHTKFVRGEFIKTAEDMGAEVKIVWIYTPYYTCLVRNDKLPNSRLDEMSEEFEIPSDDEAPVEVIRSENA